MKNRKILSIAGVLILAAAAGYLAFNASHRKNAASGPAAGDGNQKIEVVASFYPLADFAAQVGGNYVRVFCVTPAGSEPHDYEPTPQEIEKAYRARLFISNGAGMDAWADRIEDDLKSKGVAVVRMSDHPDLTRIGGAGRNEAALDPHFWLDPVNAEKEAGLIAAALAAIDPGHKADFERNLAAFDRRLADLDREYRDGLAGCALREIVVSHNAFAYLARRYNLTQVYISGLTPDEEPSPQKMAQIADLARQKNIKYIFFETLVSPRLAQTIAREIGAKTLVLNPIEGLTEQEIAQGQDYISVMKENLRILQTALSCK